MKSDRLLAVFCVLLVGVAGIRFYFFRGKVKASPPARAVSRPVIHEAPKNWPPQVGQPYPDIEMTDQTGRAVHLSEFKGKVIAVEPVSMESVASQAWSGAHDVGPVGKVVPQDGLESWQKYFPQYAGIPFDDERFVHVQLLYYNLSLGPTAPDDAKQWATHFGLDRSKNRIVLAGSGGYRTPGYETGTRRQVPGLQVIDQQFVLRADASGHPSKDDLYHVALPLIGKLVANQEGPVEPRADLPWNEILSTRGAYAQAMKDTSWAVDAIFKRQDYASVEKWVKNRLGKGKISDDKALSTLYYLLGSYDLEKDPKKSEQVINTWCTHSPDSHIPYLVRGIFKIRSAWSVRGEDLAYAVPKDAWEPYRQRLEQALGDLEKAYTLQRRVSASSVAAIQACMGLSRPYKTVDKHFQRAIEAEPGNLAAYSAMLYYLSPKWSSNKKEAIAFVKKLERDASRYPQLKTVLIVGEAPYWQGKEAEDARNFEKAIGFYKKAGDQGLHTGYMQAAWLLSESSKMPHRYADALVLYQKCAATFGNASSYYAIGKFYEKGMGVAPDMAKALEFYIQAAEKGLISGMNKAGWILLESKDYAKSMAWYQKAADKGNANAMLKVGWMHFNGWGVPQDYRRALDWYEKSAAAGNAQAMNNLGWSYHKGLGVPANKKKAREWYLKAIENKNKQAAVNLKDLRAGR